MKHGSWDWFTINGLHTLHLFLALLGVTLLIILIGVLTQGTSTTLQTTRFESAQVCVETPIVSSYDRRGISRVLERPLTAPDNCWKPLSLPFFETIGESTNSVGEQPINRVWFRVHYRIPDNWDSSEALLIYIPRVSGLAWQVNVDGETLGNNLDNWQMTWNTPVTARLLPGEFQAGQDLSIRIAIAFLPKMGYVASRITAGPASAVGTRISSRSFLQVAMPLACSTLLLLMAGFFFAFWLSRRNEPEHLLLATAAIVWCISDLQYILPRQDDPLNDAWYSAISNMSVSWFMWLIYLFVLRFDSRRTRWIEWTLPLYVLVMTLFCIAGSGLLFEASDLIHIINAAVACCVTALILMRAFREGSLALRVIAVALFATLLTGIHDVALCLQSVHPESIYLLPYGGMLVFGSFLFAVQRRYVQAIEDHEALSSSLTQQLAAQKAELDNYHLQLRDMERKETLASERQRLMHDMHDGIGSSLLTALAAAEQQDLPQPELSKILRSCIDDLRLVIDSLDPMEQDLITLLATIRYRLEPQFNAAGLELKWDIDDLPELCWLESSHSLHILRILQEAFANVIKHANATQVRVTTRRHGADIEIRIEDNGRGFDPESTSKGRGLRSLKQRSELLGGKLQLTSGGEKGTALTFMLPISQT